MVARLMDCSVGVNYKQVLMDCSVGVNYKQELNCEVHTSVKLIQQVRGHDPLAAPISLAQSSTQDKSSFQ